MRSRILLLPFLFFPLVCAAQHSIQGVVFDAQTETPLPGAHVFIANTTHGVSTDRNGAFEIPGLQPIHYELVVSFVGYGTQVFEVLPGEAKQYRVLLGPAVTKLREIVIQSARQKKASLKDFKDHFIGLSENAASCEIENPDVLYIAEENHTITAATDSTLLLKNNALGYRIKVLLDNYQYNKATTRLYYEGLMVFEPLDPKNEKEKMRWAENRLKSYYGSQIHFFRALYNQKLNEEGFYFRLQKNSKHDSIRSVRSSVFKKRIRIPTIVDYRHIIDSVRVNEQPVLKFDGLLLIAYINEEESSSYQLQRNLAIQKSLQMSELNLKDPAYVLPDGRAYPVNAVEARGYWSWELMAEYLPLDYDPEDDLKLLEKK